MVRRVSDFINGPVENMKKLVNVGLVQINNSFSGQEYLPLSIGLLHAYFQKYSTRKNTFAFLPYVFRREVANKCADKLETADIVGFSVYMWNLKISLEIARILKARCPEITIVFGGPQIPNNAELFLRQYRHVDIVCHGEGEDVFRQILEHCDSRAWSSIQSVSYFDKEESFHCNPRIMRIDDLSRVPSPYLEGVYDELLKSQTSDHWLSLWETNRGCPFSCAFCEWGAKSYNKVNVFDLDRLKAEMDWFARNKIEFIFCCDANFGLLERDVEIAEYVAQNRKNTGYPRSFSVQSSKNATEKVYRIQKLLSDSGLSKGVLLAVQSLNPETLENIDRSNISMAAFDELQRRFKAEGITTFTDVIIGLPEETYESFVDGVSHLIERGQHNRIQFINLSILSNSSMGSPEYRSKYGMVTVESKLINIHGSLGDLPDDISETQELVVATASMPKAEWVRSRVFAWMTGLIYFDKLLQIPLAVLNGLYSLRYRDLLGLFSEINREDLPVITEIQKHFRHCAENVQQGGPEYCYSTKWLNIYWPADEFVMIRLFTEGMIEKFYDEAGNLLRQYLKTKGIDADPLVLSESIEMNKQLLRLPRQRDDKTIILNLNIWEVYQAVLAGKHAMLESGPFEYTIRSSDAEVPSWEDWCRYVIWYGNKKGAYLYDCNLSKKC